MPRLDVYRLLVQGRRNLVVDVQAAVLERLKTRAVVPLLPRDRVSVLIDELNPVFEIAGELHVFMVQAIATVPRAELRQVVASLDGYHTEITRALDRLLIGF